MCGLTTAIEETKTLKWEVACQRSSSSEMTALAYEPTWDWTPQACKPQRAGQIQLWSFSDQRKSLEAMTETSVFIDEGSYTPEARSWNDTSPCAANSGQNIAAVFTSREVGFRKEKEITSYRGNWYQFGSLVTMEPMAEGPITQSPLS